MNREQTILQRCIYTGLVFCLGAVVFTEDFGALLVLQDLFSSLPNYVRNRFSGRQNLIYSLAHFSLLVYAAAEFGPLAMIIMATNMIAGRAINRVIEDLLTRYNLVDKSTTRGLLALAAIKVLFKYLVCRALIIQQEGVDTLNYTGTKGIMALFLADAAGKIEQKTASKVEEGKVNHAKFNLH